jgi:hypothetical protein
MFWSPTFGTSLLSQNWSAYAAQTIIAERGEPAGDAANADWEDYWSISSRFDEAKAEAVINGRLRGQHVEFQRCHSFRPEGVDCSVKLSAQEPAIFAAMWECFPYSLATGDRLEVTPVDNQGTPVNNRPASAVVFRNRSAEAHVIVFAQPRRCLIGEGQTTDNYGQVRKFGRVLAELPASWENGQTHTVRWCIMAVPVNQVGAAIQSAITRLNE